MWQEKSSAERIAVKGSPPPHGRKKKAQLKQGNARDEKSTQI
jgi:hypothetical protein